MANTVDPMNGKRILIVEDDYFIADEMIVVFKASGAIIVGPAASVDSALHLIANSGPIDGVVLDINLHGEMSYKVADTLIGRHIPFVFATGYDRSALPDRYCDILVCLKPITPESLGNALFRG